MMVLIVEVLVVMAEGMMVLVYGNRSVGGADNSVDGRGGGR